MFKKLQVYIFMLIFFVAIFILFRFSGTFVEGTFGAGDIYISHKIDQNRLTVKSANGFYEISFLNDEMAEVSFYNDSIPKIDTSYAVILAADRNEISFENTASHLLFQRTDYEVLISKKPLAFAFIKNADTLLRSYDGFFDHDTLMGFRFNLGEQEKIYGAGFRTTPVNRRGQRFMLYNKPQYGYGVGAPDLNFSVPFVLSSQNYGLLFDNYQKGFLDIDNTRENVLEFSSIGGKMSYIVLAGENYDSILNNYHELTGFQPMPPRWALGNIQSRFGYETQEEAESVVDKMLEAGFPLDALIIDLFWFGEGVHDSFYMGNLEWYKKNWPAPEEMISRFKEKNVKTVLITEPFILEESKYYDTLSSAGMLGKTAGDSTYLIETFWFGPGGLFDIFQPRMQEWFWKKYKAQIEIGVDGWWGDLGEPETHPPGMHHLIGKAEEVHNIYGHVWHKLLWDRYGEEYPETRLFNLNRSGFAGSQRYAIFPWSGDVSRSWDGLKAQPTAVLGMTLSGFSYMHSDLGGFAMGEEDEEMYVRWLQYGTFNPVYRVHGDFRVPVEPYLYSDKAQDILRRFIKLRYQMLPYNYTLAWLNTTTGSPLTRPLFFEEPQNEEISNIDDTYLWGADILVAPILEKGQTTRKLYMPEGTWYDLFTDKKYNGGRWIEKPVTLETIPVFARGGSFIPMIEPIQSTEEYTSEKLIIHYYADHHVEKSDFIMYDDDGKTKDAIGKNLYELMEFKARNFDGMMMFSFNRQVKGKYIGMPAGRTIELVIHGIEKIPGSILIEDKKLSMSASEKLFETSRSNATYYDQDNLVLKVRFEWEKSKINLQVKISESD
jgi:oligosaccharide 4-alpha-D-glucosyltransferase